MQMESVMQNLYKCGQTQFRDFFGVLYKEVIIIYLGQLDDLVQWFRLYKAIEKEINFIH